MRNYTMLSKIKATFKELHEKLGRFPTNQEIASELGFCESSVKGVLDGLRPIRSLDAPVVGINGSDMQLADILENPNNVDPYTQVELDHLLSLIDEKEGKRLYDCFVLDSVEETAKKHGIERRMISRSKQRALRRLQAIVSHSGVAS